MNKCFMNKLFGRIALMALLLCFAFSSLSGCFLMPGYVRGLEFLETKIVLNVGDEIDLYDYININPASSLSDISIISANENVVTATYGLGLKALSVGRTLIKASAGTKSDSCTIEVVYAQPKSVEVFSYGSLLQSSASALDFFAVTNDYIDPDYDIKWYLGDGDTGFYGSYYSFLPSSVEGRYAITAKIAGTEVSDTATVMITSKTISASISEVEGGYLFSPSLEGIWEWSVNGEPKSSFDGKNAFTFVPREAGVYSITATFFGEPVAFDNGETEFVFTKNGEIMPSNLSFDYDNGYPDSTFSWQIPNVIDASGFEYFVSIFDEQNLLVGEYSSATTKDLFDGMSFDCSNIVDITKSYTLKVAAKKDGVFAKSGYSSIKTQAIPASAIPYLSRDCLGKNFYLTSDTEFFEVYEYVLWMRAGSEKVKSEIVSAFSVYMAYDSVFSAVKLCRMALSRSAQSGLYYIDSPTEDASKGAILNIKITFASDSHPSKTTTATNYSSTLQTPHVAKNTTTRTLDIESKPLTTEEISTSNELYYVVEKGFRPNIKSGSKASELYTYAKNLLSQIISDDMTDFDKIHAVYDWILWRTHYDKRVTLTTDLAQSVKLEAYYMESVLNDTYPFSVCDGLSKTLSLLLNMEGIRCVRVIGKADSGNNKWGEHAWNKVFYEGEWYALDCTWGDYDIGVDGTVFESASHQFLMLSETELSRTHREYQIGGYPSLTRRPFLVYRNTFTHGNVSTSLFVGGYDTLQSRAGEIADYVIASRLDSSSSYYDAKNVYYGTDIFIQERFYANFELFVKNALASRGYNNSTILYIQGGNTMFILLRY